MNTIKATNPNKVSQNQIMNNQNLFPSKKPFLNKSMNHHKKNKLFRD